MGYKSTSEPRLPPPPPLYIDPPVLNSANPWATDLGDLTALFHHPNTGAVTTRTSLIRGFKHDPAVHQYAFFNTVAHSVNPVQEDGPEAGNASLNSLGYSPHVLDEYLIFIRTISSELSKAGSAMSKKGFIISVTGSPEDIVQCYRSIAAVSKGLLVPLAMEINLSCPNIPGSPPPAYDGVALLGYLRLLVAEILKQDVPRIPFGLKTPPYTHAAQYQGLIDALLGCVPEASVCPVTFITATNTLGSCMILQNSEDCSPDSSLGPALPGLGIGGMAGAPLHPLALGNVATIRRMLDEHHDLLGHIQIIGTGGVSDRAGFERMKSVGAYAVGVGTGLGLKGVNVFWDIAD